MRKMCVTCPFNPNSVMYYLRDKWSNYLDNRLGCCPANDFVHICHEIDENAGGTTNKEEQCIGHLDWIKGIKHSYQGDV